MLGCGMDSGPCVVIFYFLFILFLDLCFVGGMRDRFAGMWAWSWL